MSRNGLLIGIDGSNKRSLKTHARLLEERIKASGVSTDYIDSKDSERTSSYFVNQYKRGNFGKKHELGPYLPALFYGIDRFATLKRIQHRLDSGSVVIIDRTILSDMHDMSRQLSSKVQRLGFYTWLDQFSHSVMHTQKPMYSIFVNSEAKSDTNFEEIISLFPKYISKTISDKDSITQNIDEIWHDIEPHINKLPKETDKPSQPIKPEIQPIFSKQSLQQAQKRLQSHTSSRKQNDLFSSPAILSNTSELFRSHYINQSISNIMVLDTFSKASEKNARGHYNYHTPRKLPAELARDYEAKMTNIYETIDKIKEIIDKQNTKIPYAVEALLPLATRRTYYLPKADQKIQNHIKQLVPDEFLPSKTKNQAKKNPLSTSAQHTYGLTQEAINLDYYAPRNELQLINFDQKTKYMQKAKTLAAKIANDPAIQSRYQYSFTLSMSLQDIFYAVESIPIHIRIDDISPRNGYSYPESLDSLNIGELYEQCFDKSYELYSLLQEKGFAEYAPYAALAGHKQLVELSIDGAALLESKDTELTKNIQAILSEILEIIQPIHPILASRLDTNP